MALRMPQGIGGGVQYGKGGKKGAAPVSGAAAKNMPAKQLPSTMAELAPDNENVPVDGSRPQSQPTHCTDTGAPLRANNGGRPLSAEMQPARQSNLLRSHVQRSGSVGGPLNFALKAPGSAGLRQQRKVPLSPSLASARSDRSGASSSRGSSAGGSSAAGSSSSVGGFGFGGTFKLTGMGSSASSSVAPSSVAPSGRGSSPPLSSRSQGGQSDVLSLSGMPSSALDHFQALQQQQQQQQEQAGPHHGGAGGSSAAGLQSEGQQRQQAKIEDLLSGLHLDRPGTGASSSSSLQYDPEDEEDDLGKILAARKAAAAAQAAQRPGTGASGAGSVSGGSSVCGGGEEEEAEQSARRRELEDYMSVLESKKDDDGNSLVDFSVHSQAGGGGGGGVGVGAPAKPVVPTLIMTGGGGGAAFDDDDDSDDDDRFMEAPSPSVSRPVTSREHHAGGDGSGSGSNDNGGNGGGADGDGGDDDVSEIGSLQIRPMTGTSAAAGKRPAAAANAWGDQAAGGDSDDGSDSDSGSEMGAVNAELEAWKRAAAQLAPPSNFSDDEEDFDEASAALGGLALHFDGSQSSSVAGGGGSLSLYDQPPDSFFYGHLQDATEKLPLSQRTNVSSTASSSVPWHANLGPVQSRPASSAATPAVGDGTAGGGESGAHSSSDCGAADEESSMVVSLLSNARSRVAQLDSAQAEQAGRVEELSSHLSHLHGSVGDDGESVVTFPSNFHTLLNALEAAASVSEEASRDQRGSTPASSSGSGRGGKGGSGSGKAAAQISAGLGPTLMRMSLAAAAGADVAAAARGPYSSSASFSSAAGAGAGAGASSSRSAFGDDEDDEEGGEGGAGGSDARVPAELRKMLSLDLKLHQAGIKARLVAVDTDEASADAMSARAAVAQRQAKTREYRERRKYGLNSSRASTPGGGGGSDTARSNVSSASSSLYGGGSASSLSAGPSTVSSTGASLGTNKSARSSKANTPSSSGGRTSSSDTALSASAKKEKSPGGGAGGGGNTLSSVRSAAASKASANAKAVAAANAEEFVPTRRSSKREVSQVMNRSKKSTEALAGKRRGPGQVDRNVELAALGGHRRLTAEEEERVEELLKEEIGMAYGVGCDEDEDGSQAMIDQMAGRTKTKGDASMVLARPGEGFWLDNDGAMELRGLDQRLRELQKQHDDALKQLQLAEADAEEEGAGLDAASAAAQSAAAMSRASPPSSKPVGFALAGGGSGGTAVYTNYLDSLHDEAELDAAMEGVEVKLREIAIRQELDAATAASTPGTAAGGGAEPQQPSAAQLRRYAESDERVADADALVVELSAAVALQRGERENGTEEAGRGGDGGAEEAGEDSRSQEEKDGAVLVGMSEEEIGDMAIGLIAKYKAGTVDMSTSSKNTGSSGSAIQSAGEAAAAASVAAAMKAMESDTMTGLDEGLRRLEELEAQCAAAVQLEQELEMAMLEDGDGGVAGDSAATAAVHAAVAASEKDMSDRDMESSERANRAAEQARQETEDALRVSSDEADQFFFKGLVDTAALGVDTEAAQGELHTIPEEQRRVNLEEAAAAVAELEADAEGGGVDGVVPPGPPGEDPSALSAAELDAKLPAGDGPAV